MVRRRRWSTRVAVAFALLLLSLAACRGDRPASATDVVVQFYTMREAIGVTGAPSAKELTALKPFIADTLARLLAAADSLRAADEKRAPNEKPAFAEGDLFSSLFEGPTSFRPLVGIGDAPLVQVPVVFTNDGQKPQVTWTDTAIVVQVNGRWLVQDIRYGGTWDFGNKGSLLQHLSTSVHPAP